LGGQLGTFCFHDNTSGCANTNAFASPYAVPLASTSVDGRSATYCLPRTSCPAVFDAVNGTECTLNSQCGVVGLSDGICSESDVCTYTCQYDYECPATFTCDVTGFCSP
jgi:hypothetical protein